MSIAESTMTKCQTFFQSLPGRDYSLSSAMSWKEAEGNCGGGHDPLPGHRGPLGHIFGLFYCTRYAGIHWEVYFYDLSFEIKTPKYLL